MYTLSRAKRTMGAQGEPIPTVFSSLAARGFHFRRGQLVLIAAGPGVGKSVLSQSLAMRAGCPALYFSADSDSFTMYKRGASIVTGHRSKDVEQDYNKGNGAFYDNRLNALRHIRYDFTGSPDVDDLEDCMNAFAQAYGEYPHLVIVDNLINVDPEGLGEGQRSSVAAVMAYLKTMAQKTNACIVMLHHLTGYYDDGNQPAPMSALIEKVSKLPEQILTLYREGVDYGGKPRSMGVCIVKNRDGESDASGQLIVYLDYAPDYARLEDAK